MNPKVVLITGSAPPDACGVGDYTVALASALEKAGERVEMYCNRDWSIGGTMRALHKLGKVQNALLHMQYPTAGYGYSLGPQTSLLRRCGIVTIHEFSLAHPIRKLSLLPFTLRSPLLVLPSEFEKRALGQKMPWVGDRVRVIPIGSNIHPHSQPSGPRDNCILYFGLIAPRKGIEEFLVFARLLRATGIDWELAVVGKVSPRQEAYAQRLTDALAQYNVRTVLNRDPSEVAELLARAGLAYLPFPDGASDRRGSLKAALAAGLPCITTCSEQTPQDLAQTVVQANTPQAALEATIRLISSPEVRATMSQRSHEYSRQFSWERIAQLHIHLYAELRSARPMP